METEILPEEVQALLRERIGSFEQLHVLLLLFRERRDWSESELATEVKLVPSEISTALSALVAHHLVSVVPAVGPDPKYRYASGVQDAAVEDLVRAYVERPIAVIRLLAERSIERIRADALRAFSDAFLFRKGK